MNEIKESFYKHIENGICNGAEYIINYNGKIYQEAIGFKDLEKKNKAPKKFALPYMVNDKTYCFACSDATC